MSGAALPRGQILRCLWCRVRRKIFLACKTQCGVACVCFLFFLSGCSHLALSCSCCILLPACIFLSSFQPPPITTGAASRMLLHVDAVYWFYGRSFLCVIGCFSMIVWTRTVFKCLIKLYACVFYFCICTCSAQLSMFHVEKRSRNMLIIIIINIISSSISKV